ncbi:hypothetical protein PR202_gb08923 [Eleusine coracana subsp. coracana]|uniref:Calponin-homology (CH) domain-containing protein n=1 Tax=Eleusine coracana subsp. coracana TaxID=191504 RepID=A0AAV5EGA4_ELECO|nr:hypothetical protein PR202_gb08923 [Eleusine coracana subsp. coracana]
MSTFFGVLVSDPGLQSQFTQVQLRTLKTKFVSAKRPGADHVTIKDLPPVMEKLRGIHEVLSEEEVSKFLSETYPDMNQSIEFEPFLKPHLVLGLLSQIIKIQLLADLNLKKTPQLAELVADDNGKGAEELITLAPDKMLLKWMNFHLKKAGYKKTVTNFSTDVKDGEAYAYLLSALAPEHSSKTMIETTDPKERAKKVLETAEKLECTRYVTPKDIVEGSANLNLANGLSTTNVAPVEDTPDDVEASREERAFRLWINSLGIATYVNNLFEDVRTGWVLLEVLDKISPGSVNWKQASKPPIIMPFRKVENCNQVIKIGKELNFSLVNVAGNDFVQGNKKLILAFLWQLMRTSILQLLKNLRSHSKEKEMTDADILIWANNKVKESGKTSRIESFKDKSIADGVFFLELLSAVQSRVVDWSLVKKGEDEEEKKLNATYIISVARKLGCTVFLLPEDIMEVNPKMILTLTATIMYWSLQRQGNYQSPGQSVSREALPEEEEIDEEDEEVEEEEEDFEGGIEDGVSNLTT